ncbi:MAG: pilus assembly protein PilM [Candidatus Nanopelagicales bacterium]|nr:pilus assembly protein PilM [Candidatus Nanopelagicales bacterium]
MSRLHLTRRASHAVGVRFEPSRIQAVELHHSRGSMRIKHATEVALPEGAIVNGVITDRSGVTKALRKTWRQGHFTTRNVVFSVDGASITLEDLVEGDQIDARTNALAIQIASETLIDARLTPIATEALPSALARTVHNVADTAQMIAAVDIASDVVTVAFVNNAGLQFTRSYANQGTDIAALTLESTFGISFEQARERIFAITSELDNSVEWQRRTREILHTWNHSVANLLADCIDQYSQSNPESLITLIALTGEGKDVADITHNFRTSFACNVVCLDDYALPVALARTSGFTSTLPRTNLLPSAVREAVVLLGIKRWILASFVMLGIASVALWLYQQPQLNDLSHQLQLLRGGQ